MKTAIITIALALSVNAHAVTSAQCQQQFNKCKNDVKNIFNQNKCKKARNACEAQAAQEAQQSSMKNQMMNGQFGAADMKNQMMNGTAGNNGLSMKDKMMAGGTQQPLDPKEAARQRLLEREKAQNGQNTQQNPMKNW